MCTSITYKTKDCYFGRTLDYNISYGYDVVVTPRNYRFSFWDGELMPSHYAIVGMAHVEDNCPLYNDGINEKGLAMAGLNFLGNAYYGNEKDGKYNIAPFEFIPWILGQCSTVKEARELINNLNLVDVRFNEELPQAQLHWIIADCYEAITVEATESGMHVYDNPVGVLTNNPTFNEQMFQLNNYMNLSSKDPQNNFCSDLPLKTYSYGMGAMGLPGDWSSQSRFVRAAFAKMNSVCGDSEIESISQFFHILASVQQLKGCCCMGEDEYSITQYTSCCNVNKGIYYYTTYDNRQIRAVSMHRVNLNSSRLMRYQTNQKEQICMLN